MPHGDGLPPNAKGSEGMENQKEIQEIPRHLEGPTEMEKFTSIILIFTMVFTFCIHPLAADSDSTTAKALRFNNGGNFKILHMTDLHKTDNGFFDDMSIVLIRRFVENVKPNLTVLTGDIAMDGTLEEVLCNIKAIMSIFVDNNIPVAVTFGNHDSEKGIISREDLMAIYNSYPCSISVDDGDLLPGCGTYNIPILASDSDDIAFNIWVVDSGEYDNEDHYGYTKTEQIEWYVNKSNELKNQNNGKVVHSLMFQHIIVPEIYDALLKTSSSDPYAYQRIYSDDKNEFYSLNPKNTKAGWLLEYPCPPYYNNGQFDALVKQGDVLAMLFGHDHTNTFIVTYKGIDLVATPKAEYSSICDGQKGVRVIELKEADTSTYETKVLTFNSLCPSADPKNIENTTENIAVLFRTAFIISLLDLIHSVFDIFVRITLQILTGLAAC